jgi:hypothetical protein
MTGACGMITVGLFASVIFEIDLNESILADEGMHIRIDESDAADP